MAMQVLDHIAQQTDDFQPALQVDFISTAQQADDFPYNF
jgi:hypothetical protein